MLNQYTENGAITSPGLVIKTGSSALAKVVAFDYKIDGVLRNEGAGDLPALTGITVETGKMASIAVYIDSDGDFSLEKSEEIDNATDYPLDWMGGKQKVGKALVGFLIVKNATGSQFVGGTTALDASNLTVKYVNATLGFVGK